MRNVMYVWRIEMEMEIWENLLNETRYETPDPLARFSSFQPDHIFIIFFLSFSLSFYFVCSFWSWILSPL